MMRDEDRRPECELCLDYISGVLTDDERLEFERHLPGCEACRMEIEELRIVWEALPTDMEYIEPPADLKQQVMNAVMTAETEAGNRIAERRRPYGRQRYFAIISSALALVFIIGTVWNVRLYQERTASPIPIEQALSVSASQIKELSRLRPPSPDTSRAYGVACIVDNGQSRQFVVYVFRTPPTSGEQAYQVWLIKNGQRSSAGTFRVNDDGVGLLAMPIASDSLAYDSIGITLEPDDRGDHPRGVKVLGSA
jgi:anti-sigma-K factor RskA